MTQNLAQQPDLQAVLKNYFGYDHFREHQEQIITETLEGRDTIVLMPTGGGKSLCYQIPAILFEGLTVVISPLIALMKDQVQSLVANGIPAAFLNSSLSAQQEQKVYDGIRQKFYKILYVAPERVFSSGFIDFLGQLDVKLFAIDEAHCISTWGHSFRPDYKKLAALKSHFPKATLMALTATADRTVRQDIADILQLNSPQFFISSFDRPNLSLAVLPGQKKWEQLIQTLLKYRGESGIIYCSSRKSTEELAARIRKNGLNAACYHAGLDPEIRSKTQDQFLQDEIDIICATIAFGMGIDKPDIRYVIHYNMPGNLESLYQEIGRAGRDGAPAETILFYSFRDVQTHLGFIENVDDIKYQKILTAKLKRIQEYAEAQVCRRKILMSYFSETPGEDCGNCDVCGNPPKYMDGTIEAQKAISAILRSGEKLPLSTLVEVLKGQHSLSVKENQWSNLKTFGQGKEHTHFAWQLYLQQMIQQGIMEIDYRDHSHLKTNEVSQRVLAGEPVRLVDFETIKERQIEHRQKAKIKPVRIMQDEMNIPVDESLLLELKNLRREIAATIGKPAFIVFSDVSLKDMARRRPSNIAEFLQVNGVGEFKAKKYGEQFLGLIKNNIK
jgi:ATP-dependent DNA helicase RecQ